MHPLLEEAIRVTAKAVRIDPNIDGGPAALIWQGDHFMMIPIDRDAPAAGAIRSSTGSAASARAWMSQALVRACTGIGQRDRAPHAADVRAAGKDPRRWRIAIRARCFRIAQGDGPQRLEGTASVTAIVVGGHGVP